MSFNQKSESGVEEPTLKAAPVAKKQESAPEPAAQPAMVEVVPLSDFACKGHVML